MPKGTLVGSDRRDTALHDAVERSLRQIAYDFDVDVIVVRQAVQRATGSSHQLQPDVILRLQVATDGLLRELGGRGSLQAWSRQAIPAFGNMCPLDVLAAGNFGALERAGKVLSAGVFS
jgi:hypothetical protein